MELEVGFEPTWACAARLQGESYQPLRDSSKLKWVSERSSRPTYVSLTAKCRLIAAAALTVITLTSCSSFFVPLRRNERRRVSCL